jgi:hypothetical protein
VRAQLEDALALVAGELVGGHLTCEALEGGGGARVRAEVVHPARVVALAIVSRDQEESVAVGDRKDR